MNRISIVAVIAALALASFGAQAKVDTLRISSLYTTHVIFSTDLTYADLSNTSLVGGKIIEQNKNMLALKARSAFSETCSVSALESNGTMHTFIIVYEEHPSDLVIDMRPKETGGSVYASSAARLIADSRKEESRASLPGTRRENPAGRTASTWKTGSAPLLQDIIKEEQRLYHIGCKEYDIQVLCEDISSYSDITYMVLSLRNSSGISYDIDQPAFVIEDKSNGRKRTVKSEKSVFPRNQHGKLSAAPGEYTRVAYSFDKMTLSKNQVLRIYLYENGGSRNLVMTVSAKDINKARSSK